MGERTYYAMIYEVRDYRAFLSTMQSEIGITLDRVMFV